MSYSGSLAIADIGRLTKREAEAVLWVAHGKTSWEVGVIMGVSEHTIGTHVANASQKLSASNRAHLVAMAFVAGVLAVVRNGTACLMLAVSLFGFHDGRRPPRVPKRRNDEYGQAVLAGET
ncbi:MAG: helix-turn-helix domain-containing protein [Steroidobacteraceae bacterium]